MVGVAAPPPALAVALSTWLSAQEEREWVATGGAGAAGEKRQHGPEEPVVMTVETAMGYLLVATVGLVGLFLLVQQVWAGGAALVPCLCYCFG